MTTANPYACCGACEAYPDHCRDVHCSCHDYIAITDPPPLLAHGSEWVSHG